MNRSIFRLFCLFSGVAIAAVVLGESPANAQQPRRLRPGFFEEEQDVEIIGEGFSNTFLIDALGGIADPLTTSKGVVTTVDSFQNIEVQRGVLGDRNFSPSLLRGNRSGDRPVSRPSLPSGFDRTNVIIPGGTGR